MWLPYVTEQPGLMPQVLLVHMANLALLSSSGLAYRLEGLAVSPCLYVHGKGGRKGGRERRGGRRGRGRRREGGRGGGEGGRGREGRWEGREGRGVEREGEREKEGFELWCMVSEYDGGELLQCEASMQVYHNGSVLCISLSMQLFLVAL